MRLTFKRFSNHKLLMVVLPVVALTLTLATWGLVVALIGDLVSPSAAPAVAASTVTVAVVPTILPSFAPSLPPEGVNVFLLADAPADDLALTGTGSDAEVVALDQTEFQPPQTTPVPLPNSPAAYCLPTDTERQVGRVVQVTTPDSIDVEIEGQLVTVHYIGVQAVPIEQPAGLQALQVNQSLAGQMVTLIAGTDVEIDAQGRLLRYVFVDDLFVNFQMLEWGLAKVATSDADSACQGFLLAAQTNAQNARLGIWAPVDVRLDPADWQNWPVIPAISEHARQVFLDGVAAGTNPNHFSIMGDCQSPQSLLFGRYDWLAYEIETEHAYLQPTIDNFSGQWARNSVTVKTGATVASMFSISWADPDVCGSDETPLDCEFRLNNPSVILVTLGTNWKSDAVSFRYYLRRLVDDALARNVLPILATKADSHGPDWPLNRIIVQVAYDYDIPLWNFWLAVQSMPNQGIDPTDAYAIHLLRKAYPYKRVTGLQSLDAVLQAASQPLWP